MTGRVVDSWITFCSKVASVTSTTFARSLICFSSSSLGRYVDEPGTSPAGEACDRCEDLLDPVAALPVEDASADVLVEELDPHRPQRGRRRVHLREDVDAVLILVDHPLQAADLTLDPAEAILQLLADLLGGLHLLFEYTPGGYRSKRGTAPRVIRRLLSPTSMPSTPPSRPVGLPHDFSSAAGAGYDPPYRTLRARSINQPSEVDGMRTDPSEERGRRRRGLRELAAALSAGLTVLVLCVVLNIPAH